MTRLSLFHASAFALALGCSPATYGEADTIVVADESGTAESGTAGEAEAGCVIGSDGCPCTEGGGCDPGLSCEAGVCSGCITGSDGCPCTDGGGCDPGLMCDAGVCFPGASTGDGGDDSLVCMLFMECSNPDAKQCSCQGCDTNGDCTTDDDCVCPDCTKESVCSSEKCTNDGECNPYSEGCSCLDCANHPLC